MGNGDAKDPVKPGSFEKRLADARARAGLDEPDPVAGADVSPDGSASSGRAGGPGKAGRAPENPLSFATRLGAELVAALVVAVVIGWGIDWVFHTRPFFMVAFVPLGMAAGIRNVVRQAGPQGGDGRGDGRGPG